MVFVCGKCKAEFRLKNDYLKHLRRKTPCVQPSDLELVQEQLDMIIRHMETQQTHAHAHTHTQTADDDQKNTDHTLDKTIRRKIDQIDAYYRNLSAEDKAVIESEYRTLEPRFAAYQSTHTQ